MPGAYDDDDLTDADTASLTALEDADRKLIATDDNGKLPGVIEGDSDADNAAAIAAAEAEAAAKATPAPPPPAEAPPVDPNAPPPPPAPPADETLAQFIERHKDKPPAELADLIANREKKERRAGFEMRRRGRAPDAIAADRVALAARKTALTGKTAEFDEKLKTDPDAASRLLHEQNLAREADEVARSEQALADEEFLARQDEAIGFAAKYIPDLPTTYPEIAAFGQNMGYSAEEVDGISDGRDMVTLYLASLAGKLMQGKVIDIRGNLLPQVKPVNEVPVDPRLNVPPPPPTHTAPAATTAEQTPDQVVDGMLGMSDEDFAKLDPNVLNRAMGAR